MQRNSFDVIIIGSGPGGGMAACMLAGSGLRVLILEKARLPRLKPCGGGLPGAVRAIIPWDISALVENEIQEVRSFFNYQLPHNGRHARPFLMVERSRFDLHFVERAVALGRGAVELRDGVEVTGVEETAAGVRVAAGGQVLTAAYLIAGDGASSKTARCVGLRRRMPLAAAIDAEVEVDAEVYRQEKGRATFNYFCLDNGYGWIFPKSGYLSCGVGAWRGRGALPRALDDYLERSLPAGSIRAVRRYGHPVPLYMGRQQLSTARVCLVGDAASLVDPVMGEGIRFALRSGQLAAAAVGQELGALPAAEDAAPARDCRAYSAWVHREIGAGFERLWRFITPLFFSRPEFFYRKFVTEGQSYFQLAENLSRLSAAPGAAAEPSGGPGARA